MAKEIHEQPEVGHTLPHYVDMAATRIKPFAWPVDPKRPYLVFRSLAAEPPIWPGIGKYGIERFARLPVEIGVTSEYRYREAPVNDGGSTIVSALVSKLIATPHSLAEALKLELATERLAHAVGRARDGITSAAARPVQSRSKAHSSSRS